MFYRTAHENFDFVGSQTKRIMKGHEIVADAEDLSYHLTGAAESDVTRIFVTSSLMYRTRLEMGCRRW